MRHGSQLSQSQLRIWAGQKLVPESPLYNMPMLFHIDGTVDEAIFEEAFHHVVKQSECLRTTFREVAGVPEQTIADEAKPQLESVDLRELDEETFRAWLLDRGRQPLRLDECVFDSVLIRRAEGCVWFLNVHHLVTDGSTTRLLFERLSAAYCALRDGRSPTADSAPSYVEYVKHEQEAQDTPRFRKAVEHWREKAAVKRPRLSFYGRPATGRTSRAHRVYCPLLPEECAGLRALAERSGFRALTHEMAMFNLTTTLFFALLARITGSTQLQLGTPSHNRQVKRFTETTGLFIEMFPLSVELETGETFSSLHRQVARAGLELMQNSPPGASIGARSAVPQAFLNFITLQLDDFAGLPTRTEWLHLGEADPAHSIRVAVHDFDATGEITMVFDLNADVFPESTRERLRHHFKSLLHAFLDDPESEIGSVDILAPDERQCLATWNDTAMPIGERTLLDCFHESRQAFPNRSAVVDQGIVLTYAELNQRADDLAHRLRERGVTADVNVAILLNPSASWIVAMLAVMKNGAAYVPLSPLDPTDRIESLLAEAQVDVVITGDDFPVPEATDSFPEHPTCPNDRMYLISTSGSSGQPKFVPTRHTALLNLLADFERRSPLPEDATGAWWTASTFDVSVYEIWSALAFGRTLHVIPDELRPDCAAVIRFLRENEIQSAYLPGFILHDLAKQLEEGLDLSAFRRLLVGVEPIAESLLTRINQRLPDLKIINGYGPAEATICCTLHDFDPASASDRVTPIGRPVQNMSVRLLNPEGQSVPIGVDGELHISGHGVADGYWRRSQLTAQFFHNGSYRTGDRARYLPHGDLQFLGRIDRQLKIRGHRIEPGEIVAAMELHESVSRAAVVAWPKGSPTELAAYFSPDGLSANELREFLAARLPRYLIPARLMALKELPLSTNGKVDLDALPEPPAPVPDDTTLAPAATAVEARARSVLAEAWATLLGRTPIGLQQNFIELGGDSILAVRIVAFAREAGLQLTPTQVFEHPTIAELSRVVETIEATDPPLANRELGERRRKKLAHALSKLK